MSDSMMNTGGEVVGEERIAQFRGTLGDRLLTYGSPEYDQARTIWNAMIDRRPALIVRCQNVDDVVGAVNFARDNKMLLSIRAGGHNIAGNAVCDGGLMIDLSPMRGVRVDPETRRAWVDGGATLADFDAAAQEHGLATPLGINSTTGVAGLTLGGGFGWLTRRYGLTIDNLLSATVVTAAGEVVTASESENPDLFWALRGGGGNFGVVVTFEFQLHPVGPQVLAGLALYPIADAKEILRFYRDYLPSTPEELSSWFVLRQAPPAPFVPEEWIGKEVIALAICHCGSLEDGERDSRPLREFRPAIVDLTGPMPFAGFQQLLDAPQAPGARNYWKTNEFRVLSDGLIDTLIEYTYRIPDPQSDIAMANLMGAPARVAPDATAWAHREGQYSMNVHGRWADPANDEKCIAWARELCEATGPFATGGAYVNFLTQEEGDRVRLSYGDNYDRLVTIKNKYDPTNLFRMNQNIKPTV